MTPVTTLRHATRVVRSVRAVGRVVADYWPGRRTVLMTACMTLLFLIAGASTAQAADNSERGGILAPLNVMSSEGARLDAMWHGLWPRRDDPTVVDRLLRIGERRARLFGLDSPVQQHVNTNHSFGCVDVTTDAELARSPR